MRASTFCLVVALAPFLMLGGRALPAQAQTSAAPPAPPKTGDDTLSPSTLPKARRDVKESGSNHIDELSPDEARRLERIRAKAAAAKPQPQAPATANVDKPVADRPSPKQAAKAPDPAATPEPKTPSRKAAQAPAEAGTKGPPAAAEKAPRFHATRQASRRLRRPDLDTADIDERQPRRRPYARWRRGWPEVADRAPRVGDMVPPDAPLYPVPAYGRRPYPPFPGDADGYGYPPPPGYGRPW